MIYSIMAVDEEIDVEKLARWFNSLDGWEWPEDLPGKPQGFDQAPNVMRKPLRYDAFGSKAFFVTPLCRSIESKIGHKETLRWWHMNKLGKSWLAFELWWLFRRPRVWLGNARDRTLGRRWRYSK